MTLEKSFQLSFKGRFHTFYFWLKWPTFRISLLDRAEMEMAGVISVFSGVILVLWGADLDLSGVVLGFEWGCFGHNSRNGPLRAKSALVKMGLIWTMGLNQLERIYSATYNCGNLRMTVLKPLTYWCADSHFASIGWKDTICMD